MYAVIGIVAGAAAILLVNLFIVTSTKSVIKAELEELAEAEVVIILGAGVYQSGELTPILKERVDTAISIYRSGLVKKILVSGDNSTENYNEVVPVWEYLVAAGVPESDIFLDYAGFNTYNTMYRAIAVFEVKSAIIVTQPFHLPRAIFIAESLGMEVEGLAPKNDKGGLYNSLREIPARIKAFGDVLFRSNPTYLGKVIPITGDGRETLNEEDE